MNAVELVPFAQYGVLGTPAWSVQPSYFDAWNAWGRSPLANSSFSKFQNFTNAIAGAALPGNTYLANTYLANRYLASPSLANSYMANTYLSGSTAVSTGTATTFSGSSLATTVGSSVGTYYVPSLWSTGAPGAGITERAANSVYEGLSSTFSNQDLPQPQPSEAVVTRTTVVVPDTGNLQMATDAPAVRSRKDSAVVSLRDYALRAEKARRYTAMEWRSLDQLVTDDPPEDGYESAFSHRFVELLRTQGGELLAEYDTLKAKKKISQATQCEVLKLLGRLEHEPTHRQRLAMLVFSLTDAIAAVRDSAAIGLSYLEDPVAVPALQRAAAAEPKVELKDFMLSVAQELSGYRVSAAAAAQGPA